MNNTGPGAAAAAAAAGTNKWAWSLTTPIAPWWNGKTHCVLYVKLFKVYNNVGQRQFRVALPGADIKQGEKEQKKQISFSSMNLQWKEKKKMEESCGIIPDDPGCCRRHRKKTGAKLK
jgi:hypothetical protein